MQRVTGSTRDLFFKATLVFYPTESPRAPLWNQYWVSWELWVWGTGPIPTAYKVFVDSCVLGFLYTPSADPLWVSSFSKGPTQSARVAQSVRIWYKDLWELILSHYQLSHLVTNVTSKLSLCICRMEANVDAAILTIKTKCVIRVAAQCRYHMDIWLASPGWVICLPICGVGVSVSLLTTPLYIVCGIQEQIPPMPCCGIEHLFN